MILEPSWLADAAADRDLHVRTLFLQSPDPAEFGVDLLLGLAVSDRTGVSE